MGYRTSAEIKAQRSRLLQDDRRKPDNQSRSITLPKRSNGRPSRGTYQGELMEFCARILELNSRLDFRVGSLLLFLRKPFRIKGMEVRGFEPPDPLTRSVSVHYHLEWA